MVKALIFDFKRGSRIKESGLTYSQGKSNFRSSDHSNNVKIDFGYYSILFHIKKVSKMYTILRRQH
jgi:hypothetical protein